MKVYFIFLLCLGLSLADVSENQQSHDDQHRHTIDEARKELEGNIGDADFNIIGGGPNNCVTTCGGGATTVDMGTNEIFSKIGGGGGGSFGISGAHGTDIESISTTNIHQAPIVYGSSGSESSHYESSSKMHKAIQPQYVPIATGGGSESSYHYESSQKNIKPQVILTPSGGGSSTSEFYEKKTEKLQQPIPIQFGPSVSGSSHREYHQNQRHFPDTIITHPIGTGSESYIHHESHKQAQAPQIQYIPSYGGGSSSHSIHSEKVIKQTPTITTYIAPSGGSESYSHYKKVSSSSAAQPIVVQQPSGGSHFENYSSYKRTGGNTGFGTGNHLILGTGSGLTSGRLTNEFGTGSFGTGFGNGFGSDFGSGFGHGSEFKTFGSHFGTSSGYGSSSLDALMSESERLARIQALQAGSGGLSAGGSTIDIANFNTGNLGSSGGVLGNLEAGGSGSGGYKSKSWEKSSKWSSGTEFGTDGKSKNYNLLSTAEGEHVNLNGKEAGYKAATTTVDEDGKVSTYSIHS